MYQLPDEGIGRDMESHHLDEHVSYGKFEFPIGILSSIVEKTKIVSL
jgi:hypothetical protein